MANVIGVGYSNSFRIRPECVEAFEAFCGLWGIWLEDAGNGAVCMSAPDDDCGCWPGWLTEQDLDEDTLSIFESTYPDHDWSAEPDIECDIPGMVSSWLVEGEVVIVAGISYCGSRSIDAFTIAFNSKGELRQVRLEDINDMIAGLTDSPDQVEPWS